MKLFVILFFLACLAYGALFIAGSDGRAAIKRAVRPHVLPVAAIATLLAVALVAMFYLRSINLL